MSDDDTPKTVISDKVRQATTKCCHNFKCLADAKYPSCAVEHMAGDTLFVKARATICPYLHAIGFGFICHCPTRLEIHRLNLAEDA
jgi:hypothetical protein